MKFTPGDYAKFEIANDQTRESEWLWMRVDYSNDSKGLVFGWLDSEPLVVTPGPKLGDRLAVSYEKIRDHKRSDEF